MQGWSVKTEDAVREGLSLARLEQMVLRGELQAEDEVRSGPCWTRVREVPFLRRHLPPEMRGTLPAEGDEPSAPKAGGRSAPPAAELVDSMLATLSDAPRHARIMTVVRITRYFCALLLLAEAILLAQAMATPLP